MNKGGRIPKQFTKYKGTDIATVKCQGCGKQITRTIQNLRKSLARSHRVFCKTCVKNIVDENYKYIDKLHKLRRQNPRSVT